jgi:hypothetical protein
MTPPFPDYIAQPSGLLVPQSFAKSQYEAAEALRQSREKRIFAQLARQGRTGKGFTTLGQWGQLGTSGGQDKPRTQRPFHELRTRYRNSIIDKAIVLTRQQQMKYVSRRALVPEKQVGWRVLHHRYADPQFANTPQIERRCREVEAAIASVNETMLSGGFKGFLLAMTKDELIFDRKVMVFRRDAMGRIVDYWTLAPDTVKPRIQVLVPWMVLNGETDTERAALRLSYDLYNQGARDAAGNPIDICNAAYVQEIEGRVVGAWKEDEISVDITSPDNQVDAYGYGLSAFEESIEWTEGFVSAFRYNNGWFDSRVPENVVMFGGDVDPEGFEAFEKLIYGQGGPADFHRVLFLQGDEKFNLQAVPLRQSMREMAFAGWMRLLIAGKAACYRMDPRIINFELAGGNDQNLFRQANRETQIALSEEQGFHTLILDMEDWLQRTIVASYYDDLVVRWVGLDRSAEADRIQMIAQKVQSWETLNEARAETGLAPLELPEYPGLADLPANPFLLQYMQQMQMAQQQQAFAEGAQGGSPAESAAEGQPAAAAGKPGAGDGPASRQDVLMQAQGRATHGTPLPLQKSRSVRLTIEEESE